MTIEKKATNGEIISFRRENHKRDPDVCQHNKVVFDVQLEKITCTECNEKLSPVVWLDNHLQVLESLRKRSLERLARAEVIEERLSKKGRYFCSKCGEGNEIKLDALISRKQVEANIKVLDNKERCVHIGFGGGDD